MPSRKDFIKDLLAGAALSTTFLAQAAKGISESDLPEGYLKGQTTATGTGWGNGKNRFSKAMDMAVNSPGLKAFPITRADKVLIHITAGPAFTSEEFLKLSSLMGKYTQQNHDLTITWRAVVEDQEPDEIKIIIWVTPKVW